MLEGKPQVVFHDVITIYFDVEQEDGLRKTGFSREGKHQNSQVAPGLLVSKNGYPLAYYIFEGKKFEGHTLLPVREPFTQKYHLEKPVIAADTGLISNANTELLIENNYQFI